ncbi:DUF4339 domain-containing protein [Patescibacteria group bacterium]|nr:DUF4339 domain-containing protein [Patescibacteria group bacterium]
MSNFDPEKVSEFIGKMREKSNEEILNIIKNRHDYQPEAAEAAMKIGLERNIIDENFNEVKMELESTDEWFYELKGKRNGAISYSEIRGLIINNKLNKDSLVWKKGFTDWKRISDTELINLFPVSEEPPPLTGNKVSNFFIWILAFAPIFGTIIEGELFPKGSILFWFLLNSIIAVFDDIKLKQAGHKTNNLLWAVFFVPVYLWRRSTLTKQSKGYFWAWVISFVISMFIATTYYPNNQFSFYAFDNSDEISLVKNGILNSYPDKTVGEAVAGFFGNPHWEKITAKDGSVYVNVEGDITYMGKDVSAMIQFRIYESNNTFEVNGFEINGLPQNQLMLHGLLGKMFGD